MRVASAGSFSHVVIFLCLAYASCQCRASPGSSAEGRVVAPKKKGSVVDDDTANGGSCAESSVETVLSRISSWMKEERKGARGTPFVTLAYAQTLDGMIAARDPDTGSSMRPSVPLSSPQSFLLTHRLRSMHDAILVGGSTFLIDTPRLNVRLSAGTAPREIEHPLPVVLDTRLNHLQTLLFGRVVSTSPPPESSKDDVFPDISVDGIRASCPVICCSTRAARVFLDTLEIFQEQQDMRGKSTKTYEITVYKKIDEEDPENEKYLPIKITIRVTQHRKHEDDVVREVTFNLLPCNVDEETQSLKLNHVLSQLRMQLDVESIMVEGGARVLSSFLSESRHAAAEGDEDCPDSPDQAQLADCICVTITPKILGAARGLPALLGLDVMRGPCWGVRVCSEEDGGDSKNDVGEEKHGVAPQLEPKAVEQGEFVPLGPDCTFITRIKPSFGWMS